MPWLQTTNQICVQMIRFIVSPFIAEHWVDHPQVITINEWCKPSPNGRFFWFWLVVYLPLWKICKSVRIIIPNIWKNKIHVPNHQPGLGFPPNNVVEPLFLTVNPLIQGFPTCVICFFCQGHGHPTRMDIVTSQATWQNPQILMFLFCIPSAFPKCVPQECPNPHGYINASCLIPMEISKIHFRIFCFKISKYNFNVIWPLRTHCVCAPK